MSEGMIPEGTTDSSWIGSDGSFSDLSTAPESIKTLAENKGFKSVEDIAGAYTNLESMKGEFSNPDALKLPETLSEDHVSQIYGKLGVPDSVDGYSYKPADGVDVDTGLLEQFKGFASETKMTQDQFNQAIEFWNGIQSSSKESYDTELSELIEKGNAGLKDSWADSYDDNMSKADAFAEQTGLDKLFQNYGIDQFPDVKQQLYELSKITDESSLPNNKPATEKSSEEKINELLNSEAMLDRLHPDHNAVYQEYMKLLRDKRAG